MNHNAKTDVFIPCSPKDFPVMQRALQYIASNIQTVGDIHVSMPSKGLCRDFTINGHGVYFHNDEDLVSRRYVGMCRFRPNWIYQQVLKLCQRATKTPYYFCIDADCIPMKSIELFNEIGQAALFSRTGVADATAFIRSIAKFSGGELAQWTTAERGETSYIADMQLFKREYVDEMLGRYWHSVDEFQVDAFFNAYWRNEPGINSRSMFISEYEMYGLFCMKFHPDCIFAREFTRRQIVKNTNSQMISPFSQADIEQEERQASADAVEILKLQSDCGYSDVRYAPGKGAHV